MPSLSARPILMPGEITHVAEDEEVKIYELNVLFFRDTGWETALDPPPQP